MGVFNGRLYINKLLFIILIFILNSCTDEVIGNIDSPSLQIEDSYITYDSLGPLIAQVKFVEGSPHRCRRVLLLAQPHHYHPQTPSSNVRQLDADPMQRIVPEHPQ